MKNFIKSLYSGKSGRTSIENKENKNNATSNLDGSNGVGTYTQSFQNLITPLAIQSDLVNDHPMNDIVIDINNINHTEIEEKKDEADAQDIQQTAFTILGNVAKAFFPSPVPNSTPVSGLIQSLRSKNGTINQAISTVENFITNTIESQPIIANQAHNILESVTTTSTQKCVTAVNTVIQSPKFRKLFHLQPLQGTLPPALATSASAEGAPAPEEAKPAFKL